jgi:hypothetical protein
VKECLKGGEGLKACRLWFADRGEREVREKPPQTGAKASLCRYNLTTREVFVAREMFFAQSALRRQTRVLTSSRGGAKLFRVYIVTAGAAAACEAIPPSVGGA